MENSIFKSLINFEYSGTHRAQPSVGYDDIFEQFYEGKISKIFEPDYPINIGIFDLDILNLRSAKIFQQYDELLSNTLKSDFDSTYEGSYDAIVNSGINIDSIDRVVCLKNVIIHPKFRGRDILPELLKSIYLAHYTKNTLLMLCAKPIQSLNDDFLYFYRDYQIYISVNGRITNTGEMPIKQDISVGEYYSLDKLPEEDEGHYYKLYAKALKLNMSQMQDTPFFYYETENDILEMIELNKINPIKLF